MIWKNVQIDEMLDNAARESGCEEILNDFFVRETIYRYCMEPIIEKYEEEKDQVEEG